MSKQEDVNPNVEAVEESSETEQSRREFITKLVTTAGLVAAAGLAAGAADAALSKTIPGSTPSVIKLDKTSAQVIKLHKTVGAVSVDKWVDPGTQVMAVMKATQGFRVVISGRDIGLAMQQAGLLSSDINVEDSKVTIEFSA